MSVPIHNLYDYIYQCLEKRYNVAYFYPYGQKQMDNIVDLLGKYFTDLEYLNEDQKKFVTYNDFDSVKRPHEESDVFKVFPSYMVNKSHLHDINQWIMCNDQEPLDYNFYHDGDNHLDYINQKKKDRTMVELNKTKNLRWFHPCSIRKKWILLHSELQSQEVKKYNESGLFECAYWWAHAFIALDWYRFAEYDKFLLPGSKVKKLFLMYCRDTTGTRKYRQSFLYNLQDICQITSFNNTNAKSDDSAIYNADDFNHTGISVVLETIFDNRIHLTEKTLRPIACGHPFLIASGPNTLDYLRSYGFKTFHPFINETYDKEQDCELRKAKIIAEIKRLNALPKEQQYAILEKCKEITEHNKQVFFSDSFRTQLLEELCKNVYDADAKTNGEIDWKYIIQSRIERVRNNIGKGRPKNSQLFIPLARHAKKGGTLENYVPPWKD